MKSWFYSRLPRIQFSVIIKLRQTNKQLMYTNQLRRVHTGIIPTNAGRPPFFHINRVYHIEPVVHFVREQTGAIPNRPLNRPNMNVSNMQGFHVSTPNVY